MLAIFKLFKHFQLSLGASFWNSTIQYLHICLPHYFYSAAPLTVLSLFLP